jgi:hypothetical protein
MPSWGATTGASTDAAISAVVASICTASMVHSASQGWVGVKGAAAGGVGAVMAWGRV